MSETKIEARDFEGSDGGPLPARPEHGVDSAHWNNLGGGWQILCLCGWGSGCNARMQDTGEEFDGHLSGVGLGARPVLSHR